jgi:hypothetical protein
MNLRLAANVIVAIGLQRDALANSLSAWLRGSFVEAQGCAQANLSLSPSGSQRGTMGGLEPLA